MACFFFHDKRGELRALPLILVLGVIAVDTVVVASHDDFLFL